MSAGKPESKIHKTKESRRKIKNPRNNNGIGYKGSRSIRHGAMRNKRGFERNKEKILDLKEDLEFLEFLVINSIWDFCGRDY